MFRTPKEIKGLLESQSNGVSSSDFIRKPENKRFKEMWCAMQFGLGYEKHVAPCRLEANDEEYSDTDFVLKTDKGEFPFQSTIADMPGRRMGDEHKPRPDSTLPLTPYEPEQGRIEGPRWIAQAIKEKVEKRYANAKKINLLVYANFTAHQMDYQSICAEIEKYEDAFFSIWVITNHQIFSLASKPDLGEVGHFAMVYSEEELQSML